LACIEIAKIARRLVVKPVKKTSLDGTGSSPVPFLCDGFFADEPRILIQRATTLISKLPRSIPFRHRFTSETHCGKSGLWWNDSHSLIAIAKPTSSDRNRREIPQNE